MSIRKLFSHIIVRRHDEILLGEKKRGSWEGKWDGFGGKVEPNETPREGAIRELKEECGLVAIEMKKIGLLEIEFEGDPMLLEIHMYVTDKFVGEPVESDEMRPQWFKVKNISFDEMRLDYSHWFPYMLRNEPFKGYFLCRGTDFIIKHKLEKLDADEINETSLSIY